MFYYVLCKIPIVLISCNTLDQKLMMCILRCNFPMCYNSFDLQLTAVIEYLIVLLEYI